MLHPFQIAEAVGENSRVAGDARSADREQRMKATDLGQNHDSISPWRKSCEAR